MNIRYSLLAGFVLLSITNISAQDATDALRFSEYNPVHTARTQAIGGANVSLGGDLSSASINPAGLAQFKTNEWVFSPGFFMNRTKMDYNEQFFKDNRNAASIGMNGLILSFGSNWKSNQIRNTTISLSVNQTANYNSNFNYSGNNLLSSYSEKWLEEVANSGISSVDELLTRFPTGASMAYESYLIDTATIGGENRIFTNANAGAMPLAQSFSYQTRGGIYEGTFGIAWNHKEKLFYGLSVGIPLVHYKRKSTITEKDASETPDNDFERFTFTENFSTQGSGLNAKFGIIYKPVEYIRLGVSLHTPTLLTLTDRTDVTLTSEIENYARKVNNDNSKPTSYTYSTKDYTGGEDYQYSYQLITPWRLAVSGSYVFREVHDVTKQKAFVTADLELVNYKAASFSSNAEIPNAGEEAYFKSVNRNIDELYRYALNVRLGGELKFNTWMVRGGFQYNGSPYQKDFLPEGAKGWRMIPSAGLGYRNKGYFIDLTYAYQIGHAIHMPYVLTDNAYPLAKQQTKNGQIIATVGFKF